MSDESSKPAEGGCVMPPDRPVPADVLGRYTIDHDPAAKQDIANYVHGQAHDETVQHVKPVKTEFVMGTDYEIWDVTTDKDRWWVITNANNLYSRRHFPSLDYTLSFHVGLMMRMRSRDVQDGDGEFTPFDEVLRRQRQAGERLERAVEAEDFQAVGMQLRECLISLITATRRRTDVTVADVRPKDADVPGWSALLIDHLCPGEKDKELRQYVKAKAEKTWHLVNWLTHHRNAKKTAAMITVAAVNGLIVDYARLLNREQWDRTDQCVDCASREIRTHFDIAIEPDGAYYQTCGACGWTNHPGFEGDG